MQNHPRTAVALVLAFLGLGLAVAPVALAAPAERAVQQQLVVQVGKLRASGGLYLQGLAIASGSLVPDFYGARNYAPVCKITQIMTSSKSVSACLQTPAPSAPTKAD